MSNKLFNSGVSSVKTNKRGKIATNSVRSFNKISEKDIKKTVNRMIDEIGIENFNFQK